MLGDLREYIEQIEKLLFEQGLLSSKDKKVIRVRNHLRVAKDVAATSTNDQVIAKWLLTLSQDYDQLCHFIMYKLTPPKEQQPKPHQPAA